MRFSSTDPLAGVRPENIEAMKMALMRNRFYHSEYKPELATDEARFL